MNYVSVGCESVDVALDLLGPLVTAADITNKPWLVAKAQVLMIAATTRPQSVLTPDPVSFLAEVDRQLTLGNVCD